MNLISDKYFSFLLATFICYLLTPLAKRWIVLLVASYIFYASWNPFYIVIIVAITLFNFYFAQFIASSIVDQRKYIFLALAITFNLLALIIFKYLTPLVGISQILLPLGLSFYLLQIIGYLVDVYRKQTTPLKHLGHFALFVCFLPQILSGPIEKAATLIPQLTRPVPFCMHNLKTGLLFIASGLLKKTVMGGALSIVVLNIFAQPSYFSGAPLIIAILLARWHIFCDFSGYTDIALGTAKIFGIHLTNNFNRPFFAKSIVEFWQRWHITLSAWIRHYVYYPLITSCFGRLGLYFNLFLSFFILGLWHGLSLNFIIYGSLNGIFIVLYDATRVSRKNLLQKFALNQHPLALKISSILFTFLFFVSPPTVFFCTLNIHHAIDIFANLFPPFTSNFQQWMNLDAILNNPVIKINLIKSLITIFFLECLHLFQRKIVISEWIIARPFIIKLIIAMFIFFVLLVLGDFDSRSFIYSSF
ncbi:MAG: MBOAT family protein [Oligoflexia bacterium]|nr:MBOAT family protein [Oligoflexia bacterium]